MSAVKRKNKGKLPAKAPMDRTVFARIRALRERLAIGKGEAPVKELVNTGRRI
jgi:hypothetical protein